MLKVEGRFMIKDLHRRGMTISATSVPPQRLSDPAGKESQETRGDSRSPDWTSLRVSNAASTLHRSELARPAFLTTT